MCLSSLTQHLGDAEVIALRLSAAFLVPGCTAAMAGTEGSIASPNGEAIGIYAAGPEDAGAGVVIVHDWFGVSDLTRESVDRLGKAGFRAVAVDLYDGETPKDHERAEELAGALDPDAAQTAVGTVLEALAAGDRPVAVVGYSMGARIALCAGTENADYVTAVGLIYGGGFDSLSDDELARLGATLAITGAADERSYPAHAALEKRMRTVGKHESLRFHRRPIASFHATISSTSRCA
jgi:carboxymethylenebutenolidase